MCEVVFMKDDNLKRVFEGSSCAFGVFDGFHRGHRFLVDCARMTAKYSGGPSIALTFSIDPDELFAPGELVKLMSNEERIQALASSGVDVVAVLPFDFNFASLPPHDFLESTFGDNTPAYLHVGAGFRFGSRASGGVSDLEAWGASRGLSVCCHELLQEGGLPISATRIRGLLARGEREEAGRLLGYGVSFRDATPEAYRACG